MTNWTRYYAGVGDRPNTLVLQALDSCLPSKRGTALDLGSGNFRDCLLLQRAGFKRIVAVDSSRDIPPVPVGIEYHQIPVEDYALTVESFDLIVSCNTLFFVPKEKVTRLFAEVHAALRPKGVFACNLLGERDGWVTCGGNDVSVFTSDDIPLICSCFSGMAEEEVGECEYDGSTVVGTRKHWHLRSIIYQKS